MARRSKTEETMDFEIRFYEGILRKRPDFIEALGALADLYSRQGKHEESLAVDHRLYQLRPEDPVVLYNLACTYSILQDKDKAFWAIKKAIRCGYDDFSHLEMDRDLDNLREDRRFVRYYERLKDKKTQGEQ